VFFFFSFYSLIYLYQNSGPFLIGFQTFSTATGKAHWYALLKARAIENQCWVIAAAQYGKHNEKRESYGHSIVFDPWGKVICDAGGCDSNGSSQCLEVPSVVIFDIDDNVLSDVRKRMPIQKHRRNANATW
jgi:predicted amidohydrolase